MSTDPRCYPHNKPCKALVRQRYATDESEHGIDSNSGESSGEEQCAVVEVEGC